MFNGQSTQYLVKVKKYHQKLQPKVTNKKVNSLKLLHKFALTGSLTIGSFLLNAEPARAYNIDCAILLCLAGGFPDHNICHAAKFTFIRRITPWPIEPPLQIWNCPMGLAENNHAPNESQSNIQFASAQNRQDKIESMIKLISEGKTVDFSDPTYDFIRAIKVWHVLKYDFGRDDKNRCRDEYGRVELGQYDENGEFTFKKVDYNITPTFALPVLGQCDRQYRGIAIEWTDYQGRKEYHSTPY